MVIDAHLHLWDKQLGRVGENKVVALRDGKSDFGGEIRQMMPPYMLDGRNTVEMLISNMNYARVSGCVVTQEYIDGNQDYYLLECRKKYPKRIKVCCLYEEKEIKDEWIGQFDGIKICAGRLKDQNLLHHKEIFEKAQSLQIRYTKKSKFDRETTLLGGYVKCGNCRRSLTSSSPVHGHILYSCAYSKGKEDTGCFAGKADNKMLEHIVLAEIKAYLRQNISQEQMQQSMRKQHEDSIEAYKTESADCEKCQEQIKIQNRQNYEKYHEGQMNQKQFMEAKKQLEEERERLQKRVQELDELINDEKEILMKKNVPVEQMLKYLGYENLTREMLEEYVQGIYVYDDGRVGVEYK